MPILAVMTAAAAAVVALMVGGAPAIAAAEKEVAASAPYAPGAAAATRQQGDRRSRSEVRFTTRLVRIENASLEAKTADSEQILAAPALTTLDGQTASVNVTGIDPAYVISLSPTVEREDNKGNDKPANGAGGTAAASGTTAKGGGPTLQVLWSIRLAGKTLPAGISGVTMNGAVRIVAERDSVIAEVILPDPKTGRVTRFRLLGKATIDRSESVPAPESQQKPQ